MKQSKRQQRLQNQKQTNKTFANNLNKFTTDTRRLGVLAIFDNGDSITPFRVVLPYDGITILPNDTEDEIKINIGQIFYGFNFYDEIKHLQDISHELFTEALSWSVGALAKFSYEKQGEDVFDKDFGAIMHFKFNKLPNHDYEISSIADSTYLEFNEWIELSDKIKLGLASTLESTKKLTENQIIIN